MAGRGGEVGVISTRSRGWWKIYSFRKKEKKDQNILHVTPPPSVGGLEYHAFLLLLLAEEARERARRPTRTIDERAEAPLRLRLAACGRERYERHDARLRSRG